jgi:hypothetical protein
MIIPWIVSGTNSAPIKARKKSPPKNKQPLNFLVFG